MGGRGDAPPGPGPAPPAQTCPDLPLIFPSGISSTAARARSAPCRSTSKWGQPAGPTRFSLPGLHRALLTPAHPLISPLRLKISHLDSIFLSRVAWANVGGLPGEWGGGWLGSSRVAAWHWVPSHGPAIGSSCLGRGCGFARFLVGGGVGGVVYVAMEKEKRWQSGWVARGALRCFQLRCGLCDSACGHVVEEALPPQHARLYLPKIF